MARTNIIGERYGQLVVLEELPKTTRGRKFKCQCECGKLLNVFITNLRSGATTSCGYPVTHGLPKNFIYSIWRRLRSSMCSSWKNNFFKFHKWYNTKGVKGKNMVAINPSKLLSPNNVKFTVYSRSSAKGSKSGHVGVYWSKKSQMWDCTIRVQGKSIFLGCFSKIEDAVDARKRYIMQDTTYPRPRV